MLYLLLVKDFPPEAAKKYSEDIYGTGFGLILCKGFIEKHRGKIWVVSEEDNGSTFCFTFPIK